MKRHFRTLHRHAAHLWASLLASTSTITVTESYTVNSRPMNETEKAAFKRACGTMDTAFEQMREAFGIVANGHS